MSRIVIGLYDDKVQQLAMLCWLGAAGFGSIGGRLGELNGVALEVVARQSQSLAS